MRRVLSVLVVVLFYGSLVPLGLADVDDWPWGFVLPVLTVAVSVPLLVLLHELGHVLAALLLRLPVAEMRLRLTGPSFVRVRPDPSAPGLPARFILFALAGPVTNLAIATGLFSYALRPMPDRERHCLLAAAFFSACMGLGNLVPKQLPAGLQSDGSTVLRWLFRPARQRAALTAGRQLATLRATVAGPVMARLRDGTITDADLDAFIADEATDRNLAELAVCLRLQRTLAGDHIVSIIPGAEADYARLRAYVTAPGASPAVIDAVAPPLAMLAALAQLLRVVVADEPADPAYTTYVTEMAALVTHRPDSLPRSIVLALDDLLRGRPTDARTRLAEISPGPEPATTALLIRAIAESAAGDHAQADRLTNAVRRTSPDPAAPIPTEVTRILTALRTDPVATTRLIEC